MSLPLLKLPSLDLLRGFVAAGRRMSITLAAQDLCLTQSAVSRQIHALEEFMGVRLLVRGHRSIAFTAEGERLFRSADAVLQQLQDVLGELRAGQAARPVTVTASIGVTGLWLLPRLSRLQQRLPGIDVRVAASDSLADLRHDGIDLAIRYTTEAGAPPGARRLFGESVAPVAHPLLLEKSGKKAAPASLLADAPLLEFDHPSPWLQWQQWQDWTVLAAGGKRGMLRFNQYDLVIRAALAGQGVALGRIELIRPLLESGQLAMLAEPRAQAEDGHAYWLLHTEAEPRREVLQVAEWICAEAQA
ncbi:LysR substrate-binding domain-containing protein [Herbaspirillum robiniae]|uniref:LysR family transcriptional regulator n=1 Tax=Herbaspirillum robiniae TaxID=2014887 RepID=A0ABX2LV19_9BURK|nr:LysR substrate-binding domain-containing protein [Herbaspirillum robiniae]NUU01499.1 LysR family transcriptional regulator [Herbaspirillum robiniae]